MNPKHAFLIFSLFFTLLSEAQHSVSGNLSPAEDYKWLIAYKLNPDHQNYIADTEVKNGAFLLKMPTNAQAGMYRLVYAVPQEEYYFDFIYNGIQTYFIIIFFKRFSNYHPSVKFNHFCLFSISLIILRHGCHRFSFFN